MSKTMAIDFVRQVLEQTLYEEHLKNSKYFGGKDQVCLFSFYEQLQEDYEVDRYVQDFQKLIDQQNRSGIILNGTIIAPETPQIINVHSHEIIPMTFTCGFRLTLKDRDQAIETIDHLIKVLKGRKRDIACYEDGSLFMVGTIGNNVLGQPLVQDGDFIGVIDDSNTDFNTAVGVKLGELISKGVSISQSIKYVQLERANNHKMYTAYYNSTTNQWEQYDSSIQDIVVCAKQQTFEKYKLSLSFDTIKIDQPYTLNSEEDVYISFGGSATLVSSEVELGNDLTKVGIKKSKIVAQTDITLTDSAHWLEPLEMPNNLGIANELTQLASSNFIQGKHNNGINPILSYSFVLDKSESLVYQWWRFARYGIQGSASDTPQYSTGVTPNTIYEIKEYWSSWGVIETYTFNAKTTENVEIDNTESDALSIKLTFEVQPYGNNI